MLISVQERGLAPGDLEQLRAAKHVLENTSLASRLTTMVGAPIEKGFDLLPANWQSSIANTTDRALLTALRAALATMDKQPGRPAAPALHKGLAAVSGAIGGSLGFAALLMELPISTTIMFRSIAEIARENGEDVGSTDTQLSCLEVFALGGMTISDDAVETGYFAVRAGLARAVGEAAMYIAEKGLAVDGAPAIVRLIAQISSRFSIPIGQKAAAQAVPVVGAVGGAVINILFTDHFQEISSGHFTIRRLERMYGSELVRENYERLQTSRR